MSSLTERCFEKLENSVFEYVQPENGTRPYIEVRNAVVIWTNFSGKTNDFGSNNREFHLVVNEDWATRFRNENWTVKERPTGDPERPVMYLIKINVKYKEPTPERPNPTQPDCRLYTTKIVPGRDEIKRMQRLNEDTVGALDQSEVTKWDITFYPYVNKNPRFKDPKTTGYVRSVYAIAKVRAEFGGDYEGFEETEDLPY